MSDDTADVLNNVAPVFSECIAADLPIKGQLPQTFNGTLFRNGPNPQYPDASQH